jgi:hypothetical protein
MAAANGVTDLPSCGPPGVLNRRQLQARQPAKAEDRDQTLYPSKRSSKVETGLGGKQ